MLQDSVKIVLPFCCCKAQSHHHLNSPLPAETLASPAPWKSNFLHTIWCGTSSEVAGSPPVPHTKAGCSAGWHTLASSSVSHLRSLRSDGRISSGWREASSILVWCNKFCILPKLELSSNCLLQKNTGGVAISFMSSLGKITDCNRWQILSCPYTISDPGLKSRKSVQKVNHSASLLTWNNYNALISKSLLFSFQSFRLLRATTLCCSSSAQEPRFALTMPQISRQKQQPTCPWLFPLLGVSDHMKDLEHSIQLKLQSGSPPPEYMRMKCRHHACT